MGKNNILKAIVFILSISIIICTYLVIVKILTKVRAGRDISKEINIEVEGKETEIKSFQVNAGKIYLLISSSDRENIIIIDEKKEKEIQRIKILKKESNNE